MAVGMMQTILPLDINNGLLINWGKTLGQQQTDFAISFQQSIFDILITVNNTNNAYSYISAETYIYEQTLTYFKRNCNSAATLGLSADYLAIGF